jgi:DNA-directed RNA polymerase subunit H (RpoH/RPB5)
MSQSLLLNQVFTARQNILKSLKHIGFDISEYSEFSLVDVDLMLQTETTDMLLQRTEPTPKKAFVKFMKSKLKQISLGPVLEDLFEITEQLTTDDVVIIITNETVSESVENHIRYLFDHEGKHVVVHYIKYLLYSGLDHKLVPQSRVLTPAETEEFKRKYYVSNLKDKLPEIGRFDRQAALLCARPGEVIEFKRMSKTAFESIYYRVCV